jgi:hypothetical protein
LLSLIKPDDDDLFLFLELGQPPSEYELFCGYIVPYQNSATKKSRHIQATFVIKMQDYGKLFQSIPLQTFSQRHGRNFHCNIPHLNDCTTVSCLTLVPELIYQTPRAIIVSKPTYVHLQHPAISRHAANFEEVKSEALHNSPSLGETFHATPEAAFLCSSRRGFPGGELRHVAVKGRV